MAVTLPSRTSARRSTQIYEFFDERVLGHLWFICVSDGESVHMLVPTFHSEQAAQIFEHCYQNFPYAFLLSIDGQLELARRIETAMAAEGLSEETALRTLCEGLAFEWPAGHAPA